jgi:hypothetical protein
MPNLASTASRCNCKASDGTCATRRNLKEHQRGHGADLTGSEQDGRGLHTVASERHAENMRTSMVKDSMS